MSIRPETLAMACARSAWKKNIPCISEDVDRLPLRTSVWARAFVQSNCDQFLSAKDTTNSFHHRATFGCILNLVWETARNAIGCGGRMPPRRSISFAFKGNCELLR